MFVVSTGIGMRIKPFSFCGRVDQMSKCMDIVEGHNYHCRNLVNRVICEYSENDKDVLY